MKILLITITCIGIALIILGAIFASMSALSYIQAPESAWSQPGTYFEWTGMGFLGGFVIGLFGIILSLIGGLIIKPRFLWVVLIVVGLFYCVPFIIGMFYPPYKEQVYPAIHPNASYSDNIGGLVYVLPGFISIIEAIVIHRREKNEDDTAVH
jgi:hypothetical protein